MIRSTLVEFSGSLFNISSLTGCDAWMSHLCRYKVQFHRSTVPRSFENIRCSWQSLNPMHFSKCPIPMQIWRVQTKQICFKIFKTWNQKRRCFRWPSWSSLLDESVHHLKQHLHEPSKLQELSVYSKFCVSRVSFFKTNYHRLIMFHCEKTWFAFVLKRSLFDTFHLNPSPLLLEKSKDLSLSLQLKMRPYAEWILAVCDLAAPGHWQRHTQRWTENQLSEAGKIRTWLCAAETFHQLIFSAPCCDYREFPQPLAESSPLKQCQFRWIWTRQDTFP